MKFSFFSHRLRPIMTACSSILQESLFADTYSFAGKFVTKLYNKELCTVYLSGTNKHNIQPIRSHMFAVSQYFYNRQKMSSGNNSVIICGTPNLKQKKNNKNSRRREVKCKRRINNSTNKFSNVQVRSPVCTVCDSLSNHVKKTSNVSSSLVINYAAKRFRNKHFDFPPAKKQKTNQLDKTIVIVSDEDEPKTSRPSKSSRVHATAFMNLEKSVSAVKTSSKMKEKPQQTSKKQNYIENNSKTNEEDEDIAVIWDSSSDKTNKEMNVEAINPDVFNTLFFVDTIGDKSNYYKEYLQPFEISPQKSPPCQNKKIVKTKTIIKEVNTSKNKLREIIVDGSNVAIGFSHRKIFTKMGLQLVYNYFRERGHQVKIFLPQHERRKGREYLETWYRRGEVIFTPSRQIGGKHIVSYDDRFIVEYATKCKGIIITSDQYRDLWDEKPEWRETIEKRLLVPTFAGNYVMFPDDPLGRNGPKLNEFLKH